VLTCTANTGERAVRLAAPGRLLLASAEVTVADGVVELPGDTTVWWTD
jgi:alpha-glucosidase